MPLTDNPFGYGNLIPTGRAALNTAGLELTKWSSEALRYGQDQLLFSRFVTTKVEFGVGAGGTVRVPVLAWDRTASGTTALVEGTSIPIGTTLLDAIDVNVAEYGRGYSKTAFSDYLTNMNYRNDLLQTLGFNFGFTWDALCKNIYNKTPHGIRTITTAGSLTIGTNLTDDSVLGTGYLSGSHVEQIVDALRGRKVPAFPGGVYAAIGNAFSLRSFKQGVGWQNLQLYNLGGIGIINQFIGVYNGVAFYETEENTENGKLYFFGPNAAVQGFGSPMQIRVEQNWKQDFGRFMAFAWYIIGGVANGLNVKGTYAFVVKTGTV